MGSFNDLPNHPESQKTASDQLLEDIKQNLQAFQRDLVGQLTADVGRLQAEKVELLSTINELKQEQKALQAQQQSLLSQQQIAQQKVWAKQLAEALAKRLYVLLAQKMEQTSSYTALNQPSLSGNVGAGYSGPGVLPPQGMLSSPIPQANINSGATQQALTVLNHKLTSALGDLQADLNQYNSPLVNQITQENNVESQGELLLNQLVSRLRTQLHDQGSLPSTPIPPPPISPPVSPYRDQQPLRDGQDEQGHPSTLADSAISDPLADGRSIERYPTPEPSPKPSSVPFVQRWAEELNLTQFQLGLILVLLSTMALSLHNVAVGVIGNESSILGLPEIGGVISLKSMDSSLTLLWLRMLIVVPLMAAVAGVLYPRAWSDIKDFFQAKDSRLWGTVIGSGGFLFLSQILIYIAIGKVGPGVAVTLLFMYPIVTVPLAWFLFNDRPTALRWFVLAGVFFGIVLTANLDLSPLQTESASVADLIVKYSGIGVALLSGLFFACYLISMQLSFRKLHPVPVSVIQFFTIFILTSFVLIIRPAQAENIQLTNHVGLLVGALVLGALTLMGYLLNNFGIRYMGAARASIIASSGPALTAFLGWVMVGFDLKPIQWVGIVLVTVCVASLSLERLVMQQPAKPVEAVPEPSD